MLGIFTIHYPTDNIVSTYEISNKRDMGVKKLFLGCRFSFNKNVKLQYSGGYENVKEKKNHVQ